MTKGEAKTIVFEESDAKFCDEVAAMPGGRNIRKCFACGTCTAGCPVTGVDEEYNCRKIIRQINLGMREEVLGSPLIWFCLMCYRCTSRCPQQVDFADVMRALRHMAVRDGYAREEMLFSSDEVDRLAQKIRRDMVKGSVEGRREVFEEIKRKLNMEL